ncbi:MAG: dicarboxylate/amino acid:cation symporter [Anaerococcus sp.]|uniref:dicarboxylate/amino acid:cation symporter n=1 Tax=Anaerococcus sp. TaxID=1872515 RepID=UPI002617CB5A|nr:dicarboxylate/amino acid:cation symporter [Anaerococcus sp.]MCI5972094.1 dicarboxylate/amino acid:cation symporter [Anaerococcus sp.]MDD6918448.1 dicarboxylate/amino acid:cation symporter [Peptoniphilaceae bacterium]MDY2928424.1 dicarboxylate/amino acid:cation symporter [Anaerococcus sp.]
MEKNKKKKLGLSQQIFIALIAGLVVGILIHYFMPAGHFRDDVLVEGIFYTIGQIFIRLMQMLVVPLVFFSIADGCRNLGDTETLGKVGVRIVVFYICTTALAIFLSLVLANIINPGKGMNMSLGANEFEVDGGEEFSLSKTILNFVPTNPIGALANGEMIQIIIFAVIVGLLIASMEDRLITLGNVVTEMNDLMMGMTMWVMKLAPIGVFFLISRTFASLGYDVIISMLSYMATVLGGLLVQLILVYMVLLTVFTRVNPINFLKKFAPVMTFAFSTASSNATVPVNIKTLEEMGVDRKISSFTIPLGATINMDGTAIMQGVAVVFIANAYNIDLTAADFATVILTATIASVGTAGIPSVGLITLSMVLQSVGLPVEGIAMIMGIDRILDMARSAINISGDAAGTIIVANSVGSFDKEKYIRKVEK